MINFLLQRKGLASVSATPGHTQAFHLYTILQRPSLLSSLSPPRRRRTNGPGLLHHRGKTATVPQESLMQSIRLVDVPGLGFASNTTKQESWKSFITRYLIRRDSCAVVFHLIDSRLPELTKVDEEVREEHSFFLLQCACCCSCVIVVLYLTIYYHHLFYFILF